MATRVPDERWRGGKSCCMVGAIAILTEGKPMGVPQTGLKFSFEDYLAWEAENIEKHEFIQGETFAMAGARQAHVTVSLNLASAFKAHLRGTPCRAYIADMKLRVEAADASYYPDVMVSCDRSDHAADLYLSHPILLVEILSDSTAAFDRGNKFADYRKLESLKEYVLVDIEARRIECYRLNAAGLWELHDYTGQTRCEFASIGLIMEQDFVFEDVEAEQNPSAEWPEAG